MVEEGVEAQALDGGQPGGTLSRVSACAERDREILRGTQLLCWDPLRLGVEPDWTLALALPGLRMGQDARCGLGG